MCVCILHCALPIIQKNKKSDTKQKQKIIYKIKKIVYFNSLLLPKLMMMMIFFIYVHFLGPVGQSRYDFSSTKSGVRLNAQYTHRHTRRQSMLCVHTENTTKNTREIKLVYKCMRSWCPPSSMFCVIFFSKYKLSN